MKEEMLKFADLWDDFPGLCPDDVVVLKHFILDFFNQYQPERSKREDSITVKTMEGDQKGYFSVCQISGTSDWIEMRCSEHDSNVVREVQ